MREESDYPDYILYCPFCDSSDIDCDTGTYGTGYLHCCSCGEDFDVNEARVEYLE